jgi:hypothetical protein
MGSQCDNGGAMQPQLPPGPRAPSILQTIGWWARTPTCLERLRRRVAAPSAERVAAAA